MRKITVLEKCIFSRNGTHKDPTEKMFNPKGDNPDDGIIHGNRFFGVFDVENNPRAQSWKQEQTGKFVLGDIIKSTFEDSRWTQNTTFGEILGVVNTKFNQAATQAAVDLTKGNNRPYAEVAIYDAVSNTVFHTGNYGIGIYQDDKSIEKAVHTKKIDRVLALIRAKSIEECIKRDGNPYENELDIGRKAIEPILTKIHELQNLNTRAIADWPPLRKHAQWLAEAGYSLAPTEYAFKAIDGRPVTLDVTSVQGNGLVLCTDGFPTVRSSIQKATADLAELLLKDKYCTNELRQKQGRMQGHASYDDRAMIVLKLN